MRKTLVIHPFLLAAFPILFLFSHNINELYGSASRSLPVLFVISFAITAFVLLLAWFVTKKDLIRAGVITSLLFFVFFSYGYFFDFLKGIAGAEIIRHRYIIPITVATSLFLIVKLLRTQRSLHGTTRYLNVFVGTLLLFPLFFYYTFFYLTKADRQTPLIVRCP